MDHIGSFLLQFATKEVFTVLAAVIAIWLGWKTSRKIAGFAIALVKNTSLLGVISALLLLTGFGTSGIGIGELASRVEPDRPEVGALTNQDLLALANCDSDELESIIDYAVMRDALQDPEKVVTMSSTHGLEEKVVRIETKEGEKTIPVTLRMLEPYRPYTEPDESIMSIPWAFTSICLGIGLVIVGIAAFCSRPGRRDRY